MVRACDPGSGLPQEARTAGLVEICGPLELPPGHVGVPPQALPDPACRLSARAGAARGAVGNTACCRGALRNFAASPTRQSPRHSRHHGTPGPDTRSTCSQRAAGLAAGRPGQTPPSPAALCHWCLLGDVPTAQDGAEGPSRPGHTECEPLGSIALRAGPQHSPWGAAGPRSPRRPGGDAEIHL